VPVVVAEAVKKSVPVQVKTIGTVEAYNTVSIKAQVGGVVTEVHFKEGQDVKNGELLFTIDPRPYEAALKQAEAALARDLAQAKNAEEEARRYSVLAEKEYVAKSQYDQVRANADALAAVVEAERANVENSRLRLAYTSIRSPINGRAGGILVNKGNVVKENDLVMVTINQLMPIYVAFSVPEQNLADIKKYSASGQLKVEAVIPGDEQRPARGLLTFINNAVDTATGTIQLKGTFENRDRRLWPGQFTDVTLTLAVEHNRVAVPSAAVQTGQQGQYVYAITADKTAEIRAIHPLRTYDGWTVINNGVAPGELVVTDGQLRLTPGAKVEIRNEQENKSEQSNHGGTETQKEKSQGETKNTK
jgi:multidrug efflux system membrane fusion protein